MLDEPISFKALRATFGKGARFTLAGARVDLPPWTTVTAYWDQDQGRGRIVMCQNISFNPHLLHNLCDLNEAEYTRILKEVASSMNTAWGYEYLYDGAPDDLETGLKPTPDAHQ